MKAPSPGAPPPGPRRRLRAVAFGVVGGAVVYGALNPVVVHRVVEDIWNHAGILAVATVFGVLWLLDAPARLRGRSA